ncbi:MAG: hypothetical protein ACU0A6_13045 [Shimia sp.]|jgi:hypothetical protein|uniref:hypothetical protein n=1 Tax=Shimia sp. TaxID=1954381 RepID=UPI004058E019
MPTYTITETENFNRRSTISEEMFGANFVTHYDYEFTPNSAENDVLASLGLTTLRFPGGGMTEGDFADASFITGDWSITSYNGRTFKTLEQFFQTASEIGSNTKLVIPTRVAFETSAGQALFNHDEGNNGEHFGARTAIDPTFFNQLTAYIDEALRLAAQNNVSVDTFEIGNEFWGSGQMTASEYGYIAAAITEWVDQNYAGVDIVVQTTSSAAKYSPRYTTDVYLEPIAGGGYAMH